MLHPSYYELVNKINESNPEGTIPVDNRYTLVMMAARRAKQINDGATPLCGTLSPKKRNLSIAVDELKAGKVHITELPAPEIN